MHQQHNIPDLFDRLQYPHDPGYKPIDTSHEAAKKTQPRSRYYEQRVLDALADFGPMTDEQLASATQEDFASIQPARSRLTARGKIKDSGMRSRTKRGNSCAIWRLE